ncbi:MAG: hypothetical protein C0501_17475 [Isosphaera sp.]|nr:hypothetical protein [Isosphaera sp.]
MTAPPPDRDRFLCWYAAGADGPVVAEVRALKVPRRYGRPVTEAGFFDLADPAHRGALSRVVAGYNARRPADQPRGVYITVNPVNPDLLARASGRVTAETVSASDKDVCRRLIMMVDVDPVRPSGISATDAEKAAAKVVFGGVLDDLHARGWAEPLAQESGNGYQAWYRVGLPGEDGGLVERALKALAARHDNPAAKVDTSVFNASRIGKLPGTWARKGDDVPGRPHRMAALISVPDDVRGGEVVATHRVRVEELAAPQVPESGTCGRPKAGSPPAPAEPRSAGEYRHRLLVGRWLDARGVAYRVKDRPDAKGRTVYVLEDCPFDPTHGDPDSCVMQAPDGQLSAICLHASCSGRGWKAFKGAIGAPEPDHYDPPLAPRPRVAFKAPTKPQDGPRAAAGPEDATAGPDAPDAAPGVQDGPPTGAGVILDYFRERYRPDFRRGTAVHTADGFVPMGEACAVADSVLIARLERAADAPQYQNGAVKRGSLPAFFKTWSRVAWGDLLNSLPDEDGADLGAGSAAAEAFRRMVRDAMLSEVVLGDVIGKDDVTRTERRSLIDWCLKFAKLGPWKSIRSKRCWCKVVPLGGGEIVTKVAVRVELFGQLRSDRTLSEMTQNTFAARAEKYGVGASTRQDRPEGRAAVVLSDSFVAELTEGIPLDPEDLGRSPER